MRRKKESIFPSPFFLFGEKTFVKNETQPAGAVAIRPLKNDNKKTFKFYFSSFSFVFGL